MKRSNIIALSVLMILNIQFLYSQRPYLETSTYAKDNEFYEDFSNNNNNWIKENSKNISLTVADGYFIINNTSSKPYYYLEKDVSIDYESDFEIECIFEFNSETSNDYSLLWGGEKKKNNLGFMEFVISKKGFYRISKFEVNDWKDYTQWTKSNLIKPQANKLTVRKIDNTYFFFINEEIVHTMKYEKSIGSKVGFQTNSSSKLKINKFAALNYAHGYEQMADVYLLAVGVNDYTKMNYENLRCCVNDALSMKNFFSMPQGGKIKEGNIILLLDKMATKQNLISEAKKLFKKIKPNDRFIFFFSGHGTPGSFILYDNYLSYNTIKELLKDCKAKNEICIADACYAGQFYKSKNEEIIKGTLTEEEISELFNESLLRTSNGFALFMSSGKNEKSWELRSEGLGVFSYYLIKGLSGDADLNQNYRITINELYDYVKDSVNLKANEIAGNDEFGNPIWQHPQLNGPIDFDDVIAINPSIKTIPNEDSSKSETKVLIEDDIYEIIFNQSIIGYIYIPKEAILFCAYLQDNSSEPISGSCIFLDNLVDKNVFLSKLGEYINTSRLQQKRLIISSDDGSNKWMTNNMIKFGKDIKSLKPLKVSPLWHPYDEKVYQVMGWLDY